ILFDTDFLNITIAPVIIRNSKKFLYRSAQDISNFNL
ncbi:unnamed protein product, partial [marine sediment metagenome]